MSNKLKNIFFIIGLAVFIYFIIDFGIYNILSYLYKTGWWFLPIIAIWGIVYILNTFAFKLIISTQQKINFFQLLSITISGYAINYITPFINLGGEPYRVLALKEKIGWHNSISSTILYSMVHFLSSFVFWLMVGLMTFFFLPLSDFLFILLIIFLLVCLAAIGLFIAMHKYGMIITLSSLAKKIPFAKKLKKKIEDNQSALENIDKKITDLYLNHKKKFVTSLILEVLSRVVTSIEFYFIIHAINLETNFFEILFINAFASLVINILFFFPMSLGTRESGLYLVFDLLKYPSSLGVFASIANRVRELFWILIGLLLIKISNRKFGLQKLSEVKKITGRLKEKIFNNGFKYSIK